MQRVLAGGEQGRSTLPALGTPWGVLLPLPPSPCEGQAAGERRGVTQTGKLSETQPFPAGTGKKHAGSRSGPKLGALASCNRTEPSPGCPSHQDPLWVTLSLHALFTAHPGLDGSQIP